MTAPRPSIQPQPGARSLPSRSSQLIFTGKARVLQFRRAVTDIASGIRRFPHGDPADYPVILAESRTPLWNDVSAAEKHLEFGKVQNLRAALRRLNGAEVPAGRVFSFWKQIGRATRARGYATGRLLREGCLIPAVGGGLCQLSNALYDACLIAGLEVVERHAHSRSVPGSAAAAGRDATVAWNYIDLRFCPDSSMLIEARLDAKDLVVRLRTRTGCQPKSPARETHAPESGELPAVPPPKPDPESQLQLLSTLTGNCATCGEVECFRHGPASRLRAQSSDFGRCALVLDECWPEFQDYVSLNRCPDDLLCIPLGGNRWGSSRSTWTPVGYDSVRSATFQALLRSWRSRRLGRYGALRLQAQLKSSAAIAAQLSRHLAPDVTRLTVAQSLLPFLWREGHIGGRQTDVLMTRLPLLTLHELLDRAFALHPERSTLGEYRAPSWIVQAETEALAVADRIITPHAAIAELFPGRAVLLEWKLPTVPQITLEPPTPTGSLSTVLRRPDHLQGLCVAFPGPTAARKGAHTLRAVARKRGLEIVLLGSDLEGDDFWAGVPVRRTTRGSLDWLQAVDVVVQPALVEERPRALLAAIASGVPVIATPACGLSPRPGVSLIPYDDEEALEDALESVLRAT